MLPPPLLSTLAAALLLVACQPGSAPHPDTAGLPVQNLDFRGATSDLLVTDLDRDGSLDLLVTSHSVGVAQPFYQRSARRFEAGARVEAVGFHPGHFSELSSADGPRYLLFAEGSSALKVFEAEAGAGLVEVAAVRTLSPRAGTTFAWPEWGLGVAFARFGAPVIGLIRGFDSVTAEFEQAIPLVFKPGYASALHIATADLNGDGVDELLFVNGHRNQVMVIRYPADGQPPAIELLWELDQPGHPRLVVPADVNGDGAIDLVVPDETEPRPQGYLGITHLVNDGRGGFVSRKVPFPARSRDEGGMPGIRGLDLAKDADGVLYGLAAGYEELVLYRYPDAWGGGEGAPSPRRVPWPSRMAVAEVALVDLDGDGSLDAVVGRAAERDGVLVIFGPLWEHFARLKPGDLAPTERPLQAER